MVALEVLFPVETFFMDFATCSKEGRGPNEDALVERLRQFVENSDLSFYRIASRIGTSGGTLSIWLAGKARPRADELAAIEKFLKG
jgi:helix-turn-helix protein